jgi:sugar phosphate permease
MAQPSIDPKLSGRQRSWVYELTRYQWFVLIVCTLGWVFDTMGQQLFNVVRKPAVAGLLGLAADAPDVDKYGGLATSLMLIGWATGGIIFGILGDKIGRARTMVLTILIYSLFTGISGFARNYWDFILYRFLCGLGIGGQFSVGVALVAEYMPDRVRPKALGLLQALANWGNVTAALIRPPGQDKCYGHGLDLALDIGRRGIARALGHPRIPQPQRARIVAKGRGRRRQAKKSRLA